MCQDTSRVQDTCKAAEHTLAFFCENNLFKKNWKKTCNLCDSKYQAIYFKFSKNNITTVVWQKFLFFVQETDLYSLATLDEILLEAV